jgi:hypothetical protein
MGEKTKYYYLKPKSETPRVVFHVSDPRKHPRFKPADSTSHVVAQTNHSSIVDMNFESAAQAPAVSSLGVLRSILVLLLTAILYFGGMLVYSGANNIKDHITDLSLRGMDKLSLAAVAMADQDTLAAKSNFLAAENLFATAQKEILSLGQTNLYLSGLAIDRSRVVAGQQLIDSGVSLAQAGQMMIDATQPMFQYLNGTSTSELAVDDFIVQMMSLLQASEKDFDKAIAKVDRASFLLGNVDEKVVGVAYANALQEAQTKTARLQEMMGILSVLAKELPNALGFNNPRHYLLLNQNNNELRATGGFLGSFAWVEIYKGKIQDIKVDITQRVDGQLGNSGESIMPAPLRAVTTQFGTRDSNWYLDFPSSAMNFQSLYEKAGGGTADGIIAINPTIIQDILSIFGSVYIAEKDIEITAENFVFKTQQQIELIDNDKENPKEILAALAPLLMERLMTADQAQLQMVYASVLDRIASKDVLMYLGNQKLQNVAYQLNAAGAVPTNIQGDFLSVVQSNLGGTKSSQHLIEDINHVANINLDGEIRNQLTLKYTHFGTNEFPDGINKNYLRIYTPHGSQLVQNTGQDYGTTPEVFEEAGKTVFAFWVTTAPGESSTLELEYVLPKDLLAENHYALHVQKQAGANNTRLSSMVRLSPALRFEDDGKVKLFYGDKLNGDLDFGVEYNPLT